MTDALDRVQKGDLYALLALCTKDELDPLVNPILDKWSNFLVIDECYKRFQPDHTKYHKVIGDEIRLYGGNSARNIMRGNEGPPYAEIVVDVCRKLDVPFEEGNTVRNEGNLLDIFLERRWRSLSSAEREKLTAAARESALNKISDAASIAKTGAAFILTRALFGPLGWATLGVSLLDAAFKVTIPCVLHLAGLRRIVLEERRGAQPQAWGASVLALAAPDASNMAERSNSLVVRDEDGASVLSMARMATPTGGSWHEIGESDDGISRLNPLLGLSIGVEI